VCIRTVVLGRRAADQQSRYHAVASDYSQYSERIFSLFSTYCTNPQSDWFVWLDKTVIVLELVRVPRIMCSENRVIRELCVSRDCVFRYSDKELYQWAISVKNHCVFVWYPNHLQEHNHTGLNNHYPTLSVMESRLQDSGLQSKLALGTSRELLSQKGSTMDHSFKL
jgi:hypothetical protein